MKWDVKVYEEKLSFVTEYGKMIVALLDVQPGESILDLGCGTGDLAHEMCKLGGKVHGIDISPDMIAEARHKYPSLQFSIADAQNFAPPEQYDAIFSNAALHWMNNAEGVVQTMWNALKPGGRLAVEFGGYGNVATIIRALQEAVTLITGKEAPDHPWYFPKISEYTDLLERSGFLVTYAELYDRPTKLDGPDGMDAWIQTFGASFLSGYSQEQSKLIRKTAKEKLLPLLWQDNKWVADYTRLIIKAVKPKS